MTRRAVLAILLFAAALLTTGVAAERVRRLGPRARLGLVERHVAVLTVDHESLEAQVQALAVRVAALEERLAQCGCPAPCVPCQERGLCDPVGAACGADQDGDGTDDCLDACPCEAGSNEHGGCPPPPCEACVCPDGVDTCGHDADGDGVDDCQDRCPCEPGSAEEAGCPSRLCRPCESCAEVPCGHDADGDGLDDCQDMCPCRPGPADHEGCPAGDTCASDADCDDGNGCSLDVCDNGTCRHECLCLGPAGFDCCPGPAIDCPVSNG